MISPMRIPTEEEVMREIEGMTPEQRKNLEKWLDAAKRDIDGRCDAIIDQANEFRRIGEPIENLFLFTLIMGGGIGLFLIIKIFFL